MTKRHCFGRCSRDAPGSEDIFGTKDRKDSTFLKDRTAFRASERVILGAALTGRDIAGLYLYLKVRFGRNDPYTGAGQYLTGLGPGGDGRWKTTLFISIGYYF